MFGELDVDDLKELAEIGRIDEFENDIVADICEAFAYKREYRKDIDDLFEAHKYEAYQLAKESDVYDASVFSQGDLEKEIYCKKALGLYLLSEEDANLNSSLMRIIRTRTPKLYNIIMNGNEDDFYEFFVDSIVDLLPSESKSNLNLGMFIALRNMTESGYKNEMQGLILSATLGNMMIQYQTTRIVEDKVDLINEKRDKLDKLRDRIYTNKGEMMNYEDLFSSNIDEIGKYQQMHALLFDMEGLSISNLLNSHLLNDTDIDEILLAYKLVYTDQNLERSTNFLVNAIMMKAMMKAYKSVKEMYFRNHKETLYLNMQSLEKQIDELDEEKQALTDENDRLRNQIEVLQDSNEKLTNQINNIANEVSSRYKKEIDQLESELSSLQDDKRELDRLREFFFEMDRDEDVSLENVNLEEFLGENKVIIFGGTDAWRERISERYPVITCIEGFKANFPLSLLDATDYAFFYTGYMNHKTYYRAVNVLKKKDIPFSYIGRSNIDLVEMELAATLKVKYER